MADSVAPQVRSRIMSRIRSRETKPELLVRRYLHAAGLRFRIHVRGLPGTPDVVLKKYRSLVFVHGCFWHQHPGCRHSGVPLSNQSYWAPKLRRTVERDKEHYAIAESLGWRVHVVWECELGEHRLQELVKEIRNV